MHAANPQGDRVPASRDANPRLIGMLLIAVSVISAFIMAHHPVATSNDIADIATELASKAWLDRVVHGSLMLLLAITLLTYVEFSWHLGLRHALVRAAIVLYAIGAAAMFGAALIDGFIVSALGERYAHADAAQLESFRLSLRLAMLGNQALANFATLAISGGYAFWSLHLLQLGGSQRWLGLTGLLLPTLPALALLTGLLHLDMLGMLAVLIAQTMWTVALGVQLIRGKI
jgi:hypothetical protein